MTEYPNYTIELKYDSTTRAGTKYPWFVTLKKQDAYRSIHRVQVSCQADKVPLALRNLADRIERDRDHYLELKSPYAYS